VRETLEHLGVKSATGFFLESLAAAGWSVVQRPPGTHGVGTFHQHCEECKQVLDAVIGSVARSAHNTN
jgi:hypothetical protein